MNLRKRKNAHVEVHTSALNDIMFFLLLFFLLASAVANPQVVKLLLPSSDTGQQVSNKKTVTVSIDENLNYFIDKKPTTIDNLYAEVEAYKQANKDVTIILYPYKMAPTQNVLQVVDIANKLQLKLVLAVEPKK